MMFRLRLEELLKLLPNIRGDNGIKDQCILIVQMEWVLLLFKNTNLSKISSTSQ